MKCFNRRHFLSRSSLLSLGVFPSLLSRGIQAASPDGVTADDRILVVIQMSGGNDGVNTVVPYADEEYAKHRPQLRLATKDLIKVNDEFGLHPAMGAAGDLIEDGRLAIIQGVGYPNPNRSHDISMAIWQSGNIEHDALRTHGWIGQALDKAHVEATPIATDGSADMIMMGDESTPLALQSRRSIAVQMSDLDDLRFDGALQPAETRPSSELESYVQRVNFTAMMTGSALQRVLLERQVDRTRYPATQLAGRLESIAGLIKGGFRTPVYYTIQAGYDTHAAQLPIHARLLREFSAGVKAFLDDLAAAGLSDRVCVMGFSEFGRRVRENASAGTDHGTAGPVFLAGQAVNGGLVGRSPRLSDLDAGDLKMHTDFRHVYHEVLQNWLFPGSDWSHLQHEKSLQLFHA